MKGCTFTEQNAIRQVQLLMHGNWGIDDELPLILQSKVDKLCELGNIVLNPIQKEKRNLSFFAMGV